jgi:hypothetical protein
MNIDIMNGKDNKVIKESRFETEDYLQNKIEYSFKIDTFAN